eukprot:IDg18756t1
MGARPYRTHAAERRRMTARAVAELIGRPRVRAHGGLEANCSLRGSARGGERAADRTASRQMSKSEGETCARAN